MSTIILYVTCTLTDLYYNFYLILGERANLVFPRIKGCKVLFLPISWRKSCNPDSAENAVHYVSDLSHIPLPSREQDLPNLPSNRKVPLSNGSCSNGGTSIGDVVVSPLSKQVIRPVIAFPFIPIKSSGFQVPGC